MTEPAAGERRAAWAAGVACYIIWGFVPLAMQAPARLGATAWEILGHRIVWGLAIGLAVVLIAGQGRQVLRILREPRTLGLLSLSAVFIAINWITFILAANGGRLMETSLGYYINPLINMAAGALIFREKLNPIAIAAMVLAAIGVVIQGLALGHLPVTALTLALSFGAYGIVRKKVAADSQSGFFIECLVLAPFALAYIVWLTASGASHFGQGAGVTFWLMAAGPVTAAPLLLFAWAARRIPLSAMGFLQFLGPTISFAIAVVQGEPFTPLRALSFAFIWAGAATFVYGAVRAARLVQRHP